MFFNLQNSLNTNQFLKWIIDTIYTEEKPVCCDIDVQYCSAKLNTDIITYR